MRKLTKLYSVFSFLSIFWCSCQALAENPPEKFIGRWERSGGASPMVFRKDGSCEVSLGAARDGKWTMIKGTYTVSDAGKLTLKAKGEGVTLTEHYSFEGDKLTDGVVFLGEGRRYWSKVTPIKSGPAAVPGN